MYILPPSLTHTYIRTYTHTHTWTHTHTYTHLIFTGCYQLGTYWYWRWNNSRGNDHSTPTLISTIESLFRRCAIDKEFDVFDWFKNYIIDSILPCMNGQLHTIPFLSSQITVHGFCRYQQVQDGIHKKMHGPCTHTHTINYSSGRWWQLSVTIIPICVCILSRITRKRWS